MIFTFDAIPGTHQKSGDLCLRFQIAAHDVTHDHDYAFLFRVRKGDNVRRAYDRLVSHELHRPEFATCNENET